MCFPLYNLLGFVVLIRQFPHVLHAMEMDIVVVEKNADIGEVTAGRDREAKEEDDG